MSDFSEGEPSIIFPTAYIFLLQEIVTLFVILVSPFLTVEAEIGFSKLINIILSFSSLIMSVTSPSALNAFTLTDIFEPTTICVLFPSAISICVYSTAIFS